MAQDSINTRHRRVEIDRAPGSYIGIVLQSMPVVPLANHSDLR